MRSRILAPVADLPRWRLSEKEFNALPVGDPWYIPVVTLTKFRHEGTGPWIIAFRDFGCIRPMIYRPVVICARHKSFIFRTNVKEGPWR